VNTLNNVSSVLRQTQRLVVLVQRSTHRNSSIHTYTILQFYQAVWIVFFFHFLFFSLSLSLGLSLSFTQFTTQTHAVE
jgi:hypothetical protein